MTACRRGRHPAARVRNGRIRRSEGERGWSGESVPGSAVAALARRHRPVARAAAGDRDVPRVDGRGRLRRVRADRGPQPGGRCADTGPAPGRARLGYGPIPAGATVVHDCEVRLCCRAEPGASAGRHPEREHAASGGPGPGGRSPPGSGRRPRQGRVTSRPARSPPAARPSRPRRNPTRRAAPAAPAAAAGSSSSWID